ncbi:MAG: hypothetical protein RI894_1278, partial [Bacteroidota bacterium]
GANETWADSMEHVSVRFIYGLFENQLCPTATQNSHIVPMTIAPNPAYNEFSLRLPEVPSSYTVTLIDLLGRTLSTQKSNASVLTIPCGNMPKGAYIVRLVFDNATVQPVSQKLIVE